MKAQFERDPAIERWYEEFERVRQLWINWCDNNIVYCESASEAWLVFLEEMHRQRVQLIELNPEHFLNPAASRRPISGSAEV